MGQSRRPGSASHRDGPKVPNGIIHNPGIDVSALPGGPAMTLKLEVMKKAMQRKSDTPPPGQPPVQGSDGRDQPGAPPPAADAREGSPQETEPQRRAREERLLADAAVVRERRRVLSLAYSRPHPEPARLADHWELLQQEARWLATDFAQERLWKRTAAKVFASAAAAAARKGGLKRTPLGEHLRKDAAQAAARENEVKSRRERVASNRAAGTSGKDVQMTVLDINGALGPHTPPLLEEARALTYAAGEELPAALERHLRDVYEANVVLRLQEEREWEEEVEAARRAAAESAEVRRAEAAEADLSADVAAVVDDEDLPLGLKGRKRKKPGRLAPHILEDYVELDDGVETETPVARRLGGPGRRPSLGLRPTSGLTERQLSDVEQRVRKKRRHRDFDDEDYEEPIQPRRVSARKSAQVAAELGARKSATFLRLPDKKGKPGQKALQRMDSMQFGVGRRVGSAAGGGQNIPWSEAEDRLLCAIVHEFGSNWFLVADVLSASCAMQGICRSPHTCRYRFRSLTTSAGQGDQEPSEESALAAMQIDKVSARQLLAQSLPVPSDVLAANQKALAAIGTKARQARQQEEQRAVMAARVRIEPHPSYGAVIAAMLATSNGAYRTPLELADIAEAAASAQAAQQAAQQAAAQQAAMAPVPPPMQPGGPPQQLPAQQQQQQQQQGMSPAQAYPQQMHAGALPPPGGFPNGVPPLGPPPMQQQHPQQAQQQQQLLPPGAPGPTPGTPSADQLNRAGSSGLAAGAGAATSAALPPLGLPGQQGGPPQHSGGPPPLQQQQQQLAAPLAPPLGTGSPGAASFPMPPMPMPGPGMPPGSLPPGSQQQQVQPRQQISTAQLRQILQRNQLPDGRELSPQMRSVLHQKLNGSQAALQRGMQPGMGQATPAQMQVAQNLAQQAARMQSMAAAGGVPPGAGGPHGMMLHGGGFPGMAGLRPPPGGVPFGLPGGVGGPPNGVLPPGASPQGMRPSGVPMAPAQMMAGGMPPPQMAGPPNMASLPSLLAQAAAAKPSGTNG